MKEANLKGYKCMILTIGHSEKGKNAEITKTSVVEKGGGVK